MMKYNKKKMIKLSKNTTYNYRWSLEKGGTP